MKICLSCEGISATDQERCGNCGTWLLPTDAVHYPTRRGESDAGNPLLGTVLDGKYRIQGVLGRGGMGTVFQATHEVSLVPVAVKLLHPRFSARSEFQRALLGEARKAGRVVHDNCARVLDVGETEDGTVYLAMELVDGESLDAWVGQRALPPAVAVDVLLQICRALVAIHAAGLVHRDLSARNVMVAVRGGQVVVKVLDFGIAKGAAIAAGGAADTQRSLLSGFANPVFSAPEQLAGADVDARADIYSVGILAWLLLTGRLPIEEHDPREAARATVAGRLLPLPPLPGVPKRLSRLVQQCLLRDPSLRPGSAAEVVQRLERLLAARWSWLQRVAVGIFAVAVVLGTIALVERPEWFLRPVPGSAVQFAERGLAADSPAVACRSDELATWSFWFGGFRADRLEVELSRGGAPLWRSALQPEVDGGGGRLTLARAQGAWATVLTKLAVECQDGPVDLSFKVPGSLPFGSVRLRIDDQPPSVVGTLIDAGGSDGQRTIHQGTQLRWQAADAVGVSQLLLRLRRGDGLLHEFEPQVADSGQFPLGKAIALAVGTGRDLGPGRLELVAQDQAGNRSEPWSCEFERCDTAAPTVVEVFGAEGNTVVPHVGNRAALRIRLSDPEPGCVLSLQTLDGLELQRAELVPGAGGLCDLELQAAEPGGFRSGLYQWVVRDACGNRSVTVKAVTFVDLRLDLVAVAGPGAVVIGPQLVLQTSGGAFDLEHNQVFEAAVAEFSCSDGSALPESQRPQLQRIGQGRGRLVVPALGAGGYRLRLRFTTEVAAATSRSAESAFDMQVLPDRLSVRVPVPRSRFLPGMLAGGVLVRSGNGFREGPSWRIEPQEGWRYLRGRVWVGGEDLVPVALPAVAAPPFLPEIGAVPGRTRILLDVDDVFGRPVQVLVGDGPAPQLQVEDRVLSLVAEFDWHPGDPEPVGDELLVEHGQPAAISLRLPLRYVASERQELRLGIAGGELVATALADSGPSGSVATFVVPFAVWVQAARLGDLGKDDYSRNISARIAMNLTTPAGHHDLVLRVRTTRTILRPVSLGDLARLPRAAALPPELAVLRFVPVLEPGQPFVDPVPDRAPARSLFRSWPATTVRNLQDFLLLDREVTRAQYAALLHAALEPQRELPAALLVHADDPLGPARLALTAMLPTRGPDAAPAFAAAVAAAPDSAVTGVDFYQAYTACRLLGWLCANDPELFRLPFGCELELAAFGPGVVTARNGASARGHPVPAEAFRLGAMALAEGRGASAADCVRASDVVALSPEDRIHGLDFGVREWVLDLPQGGDPATEAALRIWIGDHVLHVERALQYARGQELPPPELAVRLRTLAIVRGLALGETDGLLGQGGEALAIASLDQIPASVPGVTRCEQVRRDGRDLLPGRFDPRLSCIGFRIAGGRALAQAARGF